MVHLHISICDTLPLDNPKTHLYLALPYITLQIWKASDTNLPTQIAPDVWILTTPLAAPVNTITLICPEKVMETIIIQKPVHILKLPMSCSATSANFYLPPRYKTPTLDVNISLNMANLHMINISVWDFHILKHLGNSRSDVQLQHLTTIPSIPVHKIYQHLLNNYPTNHAFLYG